MAFRPLTPARGQAIELSAEQRSVLACVNAGLGEADTCASTGLDPERVAALVQGLEDLHLLERYDEAQDDTAVVPTDPHASDTLPVGVEPWSGEAMPEGRTSSHDLRAPGSSRDAASLSSIPPGALSSVPPGSLSSLPPSSFSSRPAGSLSSLAPRSFSSRPPGSSSSIPSRRSRPPAADEVNYRRIYETRFRGLETSERMDAAAHVHGAELLALCLDPMPEVIAAVLDNARFGLDHARLIALQHKTPVGLELLARRAQLLHDSQVQRRLLSNLQTPENVLERVLRIKRLLDIYRLSIDRELPERNRTRVRSRLRPCFHSAEPEERAALVIKTEGRCLGALSGCTFDGRTTQILCNHSFMSSLFIQNLARFPATPAVLIAKLLRSPAVQRQPQLRLLLSRHPNAGGEGRR
jgi:hypothetical protein